MLNIARVPILNIYMGGDYTANPTSAPAKSR